MIISCSHELASHFNCTRPTHPFLPFTWSEHHLSPWSHLPLCLGAPSHYPTYLYIHRLLFSSISDLDHTLLISYARCLITFPNPYLYQRLNDLLIFPNLLADCTISSIIPAFKNCVSLHLDFWLSASQFLVFLQNYHVLHSSWPIQPMLSSSFHYLRLVGMRTSWNKTLLNYYHIYCLIYISLLDYVKKVCKF